MVRLNKRDRRRLKPLLTGLDFFKNGHINPHAPPKEKDYGIRCLERWVEDEQNRDYFSELWEAVNG